jgi:L-rhamnose mutarotase
MQRGPKLHHRFETFHKRLGGLAAGYLETDDFAAAQQPMAQTGVNARWQAEMQPYFADLGGRRPDEGFRRIAEIFHLD